MHETTSRATLMSSILNFQQKNVLRDMFEEKSEYKITSIFSSCQLYVKKLYVKFLFVWNNKGNSGLNNR